MAMLGSCKGRTGIILKSFSNHVQFILGSCWDYVELLLASFLDDVGIISRSAPQNGMIIIYSLRETGEELDMFLVVFGLAPWKMVVLLAVQAGCMGRWIVNW